MNSGERFGRLSKLFAGLETDVVFDPATGTFDVHHPPAPPSGLLLDSFLAQLSGTGMQLWVDLKDLQVADISAALEAFAAYDGRYGIRDNIVVESSLPEFADALAERGFRTSFLVPPVYLGEESYPDEKSYPGEGSYPDEERGSDKESRPDNDPDGWPPALPSISPRVAYVSQDARYLEQLKSLYPNRKILTWSLAFHNYVDRNNLRLLAADTSVAVVLLNVKSRPYR